MIEVPNGQWISASMTRAWCSSDPILDWLSLFGEANGYLPDNKRDGYDRDTDMGLYLFEKGRGFEAAVMRCIEDQFQVVAIADRNAWDRRNGQKGTPETHPALDPVLFDQTLEAMRDGVEILYQPVVWDHVRLAYGIPDLLVRSDVLVRLAGQAPLTD